MLLTDLYEKEGPKVFTWDSTPEIGWWEDTKPLVMYHGTHKDNVDAIVKTGLLAPKEGSTAGWVSLAFDPNTAFGYASMSGGEAAFLTGFRDTGQKPKIVKPEDRAVLVVNFKGGKKDLVKLHYDTTLKGNMGNRTRLEDKDIYEKWKDSGKSDYQYYELLELRVPKVLDSKYIVGVTYKHG